jgi:hypothetical protein
MLIWLLLALAAVLALTWRRTDRLEARAPAAPAAPVERTYAVQPPAPGAGSPLAGVLALAVDPAVPPPSPGEEVPHDDEEARAILEAVLRRVNGLAPVNLGLVDVESVQKTVDGYKTLRYEIVAGVYSRSRNVAAKVQASVDVTAEGTMYVRKLAARGAEDDPSEVAPSNGVGGLERYAPFEPALVYPGAAAAGAACHGPAPAMLTR